MCGACVGRPDVDPSGGRRHRQPRVPLQSPAGTRAGTHRTLGELGHGEYPSSPQTPPLSPPPPPVPHRHGSHRRARGPVHIVHSENWVTVSTLLPPDTPTHPPAPSSPTPAWQSPAGARAGAYRTLGELGHGEYPSSPPPVPRRHG